MPRKLLGGADPDQEWAQGAGAVEGGGLQGQQGLCLLRRRWVPAGPPRTRVTSEQLQALWEGALDEGLDPQQLMAEALALGVIIPAEVAAEVGIRLPHRSMVSAAKARIESELKQQPVQPLSRPRRDQGGVQGAGARMGDAGAINRGEVNEDQANPLPKADLCEAVPVTSSGRPRDPGVDIEEDGVDP
ncbi:hypothetical protein QJQ45_016970 [Haematococcus lacustris]|nr:hypothetical protein QJQ45_016970 [Haematococcus lacustris]